MLDDDPQPRDQVDAQPKAVCHYCGESRFESDLTRIEPYLHPMCGACREAAALDDAEDPFAEEDW